VQITKAVGDQLRANILRALAHDSFGVLELGSIFDMAQPAMSHHLKLLSTAGLVTKRKEGTNVFYRRSVSLGSELINTIYAALDASPLPREHRWRIEEVHRARVSRSEAFFTSNVDALGQQTEHICAPAVYIEAVLQAVLSELAVRKVALEVGPGSGTLLRALASHFEQVVGVDNSAEMLDTTTREIESVSTIKLVRRDFMQLPRIRKYDLVVAAMVVHHIASPIRFFQQAARVLKHRGLLVIAELCAHNHDWVKDACGDIWLGFDTEELNHWATRSGFRPAQQQFLAQRNGFRVQVNAYTLHSNSPLGTHHDRLQSR
jgi:ArsR family transcriptional regulator